MSTWAVEGGRVVESPLMDIIKGTGAADGDEDRMVESPLISNLGRKERLVLFLLIMECPFLDNLVDLMSILGTVAMEGYQVVVSPLIIIMGRKEKLVLLLMKSPLLHILVDLTSILGTWAVVGDLVLESPLIIIMGMIACVISGEQRREKHWVKVKPRFFGKY